MLTNANLILWLLSWPHRWFPCRQLLAQDWLKLLICCFSWICRLTPYFYSLQVVLLNQVTTKFTEGSFQLTLALGSLLVSSGLSSLFFGLISSFQELNNSVIHVFLFWFLVFKLVAIILLFSTFFMLLWMNNLLLLNGTLNILDREMHSTVHIRGYSFYTKNNWSGRSFQTIRLCNLCVGSLNKNRSLKLAHQKK